MAKKDKLATSDATNESDVNSTSIDDGASASSDKIKPDDLLPKPKDIETLQHFFGKRELVPFDNSEILRCRLLYQVESSKIRDCFDIANKDTGKVLGTVSRVQLAHSWRMAHSKYANHVVNNKLFFMKESEWLSDKNKLEAYIRSKRVYSEKSRPVFFSDVWQLSEVEYESIGLERPQQFMALLQTALLGEMEENRHLLSAWHKIKKYMHKVPLESSLGGVFSDEDAAKLRDVLNIRHLNDIRKLNILEVKNAVIDFDFADVVDDINAAFKEDLARRIDKRFKVLPFLAAFTNLAIILLCAYTNKYTLIKNAQATDVIMVLLTLCVVDAIAVFAGGIRGKYRRRKRFDYVYYSQKIRKAVRNFALIGIFTVLSVFVFYQRYDGYDSKLYYRDLDDGTIAVAGLFDEEVTHVDVPAYIDGKRVTEIDRSAFKKSTLGTAKISATVTKIDSKAFYKCTSLETVTMSDNITSIGKSAFANCTYLNTLNIPKGVTEIADKAFKNSGIKTLTLDKNSTLERIGNEAFYGCYNLTSPAIPEGLKEVGEKAFMKCSGIVSLYIPGSVEKIGAKAFYYCEGLQELSIPYAGTSAEQSAKQSVNKIVKFRYPEGMNVAVALTSGADVGPKAFKKISWVSSISLDDSITSIAEGAFSETNNLRSVKMSAGITEIYASMFEEAVSLRNVTGMANVTSVGAKAFYGCAYLEQLEFTNLTSIGESAFEGCTKLSKFGNLASLKSIGSRAFYDCDAIAGFETLTSLETIGSRAFENCNGLATFLFPASLTTIGEFAFAYCAQLENVDLSLTEVNSMGASVFSDCSALTSAALSPKMTYIPSRMFYNCRSFDSIAAITNIHSVEIKQIGASAFENCDSRDCAIVIPNTVNTISERAFANNKMDTITVPDSVTQIGESAFDGCSNLLDAIVPFLGKTSGGDSGYKWTFGNSKLTNITLTNATTINAKTFDGAKDFITDISINDGVTKIESGAFKSFTKLYSVHLPSTLTLVGESAFEGCRSLYTINLPASLTNIATRAFKGCSNVNLNGGNLQNLENLTAIGDEAFSGTGIGGSLAFANLVSIGKNAFADCYITNIKISSTMTKVDKDAFGKDPDLTVLVTDEKLFKYYDELFESYENVDVNLI